MTIISIYLYLSIYLSICDPPTLTPRTSHWRGFAGRPVGARAPHGRRGRHGPQGVGGHRTQRPFSPPVPAHKPELRPDLTVCRASRELGQPVRLYVESKVAQTSASWLSGGFFQRQTTPQPAQRSGQPRPISRLGRSGRPYRPCFPHRYGSPGREPLVLGNRTASKGAHVKWLPSPEEEAPRAPMSQRRSGAVSRLDTVYASPAVLRQARVPPLYPYPTRVELYPYAPVTLALALIPSLTLALTMAAAPARAQELDDAVAPHARPATRHGARPKPNPKPNPNPNLNPNLT
eukprot:scaffold21069_cov58-Phaeocystis_antarctica.AAC.3